MKYLLIIVLGLYINVNYAQVKSDPLADTTISQAAVSVQQDSLPGKNLEKELRPLLNFYLKMKLLGKDQVPDLDLNSQLQIKNEYNFSLPNSPSSQLSFSNYYLKKCERLEEFRQIAIMQKKGLFNALNSTQPDESKELKFIREFLGISQTAAVLVMAALSLAR